MATTVVVAATTAATFGIDEAGCGALAGPIVVACVGGLPTGAPWVDKLRDSKKLTPKAREVAYEHIVRECTWVSTERVTPQQIDATNVHRANREAMGRLVAQAPGGATRIVVDGNREPIPTHERVECMVKADTKVREVMAASIVAKVTRDREMVERGDDKFHYERHKGYATRAHYEELATHGPVPGWHRMSFNLRLGATAGAPQLAFRKTKPIATTTPAPLIGHGDNTP